MKYAIALAVWTLLSAGGVVADESERDRDNSDRRGPPQAAVEACASAVQGDPCSFEGRRGEAHGGQERPGAQEHGEPERQCAARSLGRLASGSCVASVMAVPRHVA